MCDTVNVDVSNEDAQLLLAVFSEFCLGGETDSFSANSRQHQLT